MKKILFIFLFISLIFTLPGFSKRLVVLPELADPTMVEISGDEIYILDDVIVHVYSLKDHRHLRKFGKKGEGPGEIFTTPDMPITMQLFDEYIILNSFNKMIYFSKSGRMIKEKRIPFIAFQVIPFGENYAVTKFNRSSDGTSKASVLLFDSELKEIKRLYENDLLNDLRKGKIAVPLVNIFIRCSDERVFVFDQQKEFVIEVFDLGGNNLSTIKMDYRKIKISEAYKKKTLDWLKVQPAFKTVPENVKDMIYFTEYLPVVRNSLVKDQKIFVQTYKTRDRLSEFFILDFIGKVNKQLFLPGADRDQIRPSPAATYAFQGNKYYYLVEDMDEEQWELHVENIK